MQLTGHIMKPDAGVSASFDSQQHYRLNPKLVDLGERHGPLSASSPTLLSIILQQDRADRC